MDAIGRVFSHIRLVLLLNVNAEQEAVVGHRNLLCAAMKLVYFFLLLEEVVASIVGLYNLS